MNIRRRSDGTPDFGFYRRLAARQRRMMRRLVVRGLLAVFRKRSRQRWHDELATMPRTERTV